MDFRDENFLAFVPEVSPVHARWIHEICRELAGFEPQVEAIVSSGEDIISMVAAGRGVWLGPEIAFPAHLEAVSYLRLEATGPQFEIFVIWNREEKSPATAQQFVRILKEFTNSELTARGNARPPRVCYNRIANPPSRKRVVPVTKSDACDAR